jgi:hypothetical protein
VISNNDSFSKSPVNWLKCMAWGMGSCKKR